MREVRSLFGVGVVMAGIASGLLADDAAAQSMVKDGDRIVFVGDSITGLGVNSGPTDSSI